MDVSHLNEQFGLYGQIEWLDGAEGFPIAHIGHRDFTATVSLYGGQLLTWRPSDQAPVLWISELATLEPGKAIRGGVPIIFPWFGAHPTDSSKPSHGVARNRLWRVVQVSNLAGGEIVIQMSLTDDEETRPIWAHRFRLDVVYVIGRTLTATLTAFNIDDKPFTMGGALHTYFAVGSTPVVSVDGLEGAEYDDKVIGGLHIQKYPVQFEEEVDRVYFSAEPTIIYDPTLQRQIHINKRNSDTTVVWNPGVTAKKADLSADAWSQFICVEAAKHGDDVVTLAPGEHFAFSQTIRVTGIA